MSNPKDKKVLETILNCESQFDESNEAVQTKSKYNTNDEIGEAKKLEAEGVKSAEAGDLKQSIEYFTIAINRAPDWASAYNNRAQALRLSGDVNEPQTIDLLNDLHRKLKKELQNRIQSLKKSVTKGDRKKKKEIDLEIEKLEKDFDSKCKLELQNLEEKLKKKQNKQITTVDQQAACDTESEDETIEANKKPSKISKTKKRREKKEKSNKQRDNMIAEQEIENKKGPAYIELTKIQEKLKKMNLKVKEVIPDGNCMYYAIIDQLNQQPELEKNIKTYQELRSLTSQYLLKNPTEFQAYLCSEETGDPLNEEEYGEYCRKINDTLVWGGQIELKAISDMLTVKIEVVQAEGSDIIIGETNSQKLVITYHRYMFGSGALNDLNKAIDLALNYEDFKVYALALTQKGTILRLNGKENEALKCFEAAAQYGNNFAKYHSTILNPFAKLCNSAFKKMQQENLF